MTEHANAGDDTSCSVITAGSIDQGCAAHGHFDVTCVDADGDVVWTDTIENLVVTVGKNAALDAYLAGSAYTVTGPFMGLVSGASAPTVAAADTMSSHVGWLESGLANPPTYTAPRKTAAWSAAASGAKALSAALSFAITGSGTVAGAFIAFGSGATSTIDNTAGVLYSAGTFTGGNKVVANTDTIQASYTTSL